MAIIASLIPEHISDRKDSWRRLRDFISPVLQVRIHRAIRRGEPVALGTWSRPFESLSERRALLDLLPLDRSLVVRLRCKGREILDELPRLARLDHLHDLSVEWLVDRPHRLGWSRTSLEAAGRLAAEGIRVRLVWRSIDRGHESGLEDWMAEARRLGIWDVGCISQQDALGRRFDVLRMEYGFPLHTPGRG